METTKILRSSSDGGGSADAWRNDQRAADAKTLALLGALLGALIGSAGVYAVMADSAASGARPTSAAPAPDATITVPYFPSRFVNPVKADEPQPPTF